MSRDEQAEVLVKKTPFWSLTLLILSQNKAGFGKQNGTMKTGLASSCTSAVQRCEQLKNEVERSWEIDILGPGDIAGDRQSTGGLFATYSASLLLVKSGL